LFALGDQAQRFVDAIEGVVLTSAAQWLDAVLIYQVAVFNVVEIFAIEAKLCLLVCY